MEKRFTRVPYSLEDAVAAAKDVLRRSGRFANPYHDVENNVLSTGTGLLGVFGEDITVEFSAISGGTEITVTSKIHTFNGKEPLIYNNQKNINNVEEVFRLIEGCLENYIKISDKSCGSAAPSPADELKKFGELMKMGLITPEEFAAKKRSLLGM